MMNAMMKTGVRWLAIAAAGLMIAACQSGGDHASSSAGAAPMELKLYSVPAARADAIHRSLSQALGARASVSAASTGRLLIYASRDTQASIGQAIEAMDKAAPPVASTSPANNQGLQIRFWVVDAFSGPGSDDPALKELAPAFASVTKSLGPMHFILATRAFSASSMGHAGQIQTGSPTSGQVFDFSSKPADDGHVQLHVGYYDASQGGLARLQTDLDVQPGQYVVLAQGPGACGSGNLTNGQPQPCTKPALRLLVVRVDRMPPAA